MSDYLALDKKSYTKEEVKEIVIQYLGDLEKNAKNGNKIVNALTPKNLEAKQEAKEALKDLQDDIDKIKNWSWGGAVVGGVIGGGVAVGGLLYAGAACGPVGLVIGGLAGLIIGFIAGGLIGGKLAQLLTDIINRINKVKLSFAKAYDVKITLS